MKVAIVGTGISGLTCAYILNRKHEVTMFEKNDYIGGHTHTHRVKDGESEVAVDSGFIVFNEKTYPNFIKLMDQLNVDRKKTSMGFSVKSISKNLEYAGNSLNSVFAQRLNFLRPSFLLMVYDILRFNKKAKKDLDSLGTSTTLGEYLSKNKFSNPFIENYIVPMGAAIWSTRAGSILQMPALFFIRFFKNHDLLQITDRSNWWVIKGGSSQYVSKMVKGFRSKIRLNSCIKSIKRTGEKVLILGENDSKGEEFDKVIIATHSDQALKMLDCPTKDEVQVLGALPYQRNSALLHSDESVLPSRRLAWSSWNYMLDKNPNQPVALTYNMNILQGLEASKTFCVTLNSNESVSADRVIKELDYEHPLFTIEGFKSQKRKSEISGKNNTYYCGAYWHNGFHEDGVVSALEVCSQFGLEL